MRRSAGFHRVILLALVFGIGFSCNPKLEQKSWERLDRETALDEMYGLTGRIATLEDPDSALEEFLDKHVPGLRKRVLFLAGTLVLLANAAKIEPKEPGGDAGDWLPDGGEAAAEDESGRVTGTYMYLRVACPGPDSYDFGQTFEYGQFVIDSGNLNSFSMYDWTLGADLLFQFQECQTPAGTLDAESAGYLFGGFNYILVDLLPFDLHLGAIRAVYAMAHVKGGSVLIDTGSTGTFRIEFTIDDDVQEVTFVARNGRIECSIDALDGELFGCAVIKS